METFDLFCLAHNVSAAERKALAHYLAALRYRKTIEACLV